MKLNLSGAEIFDQGEQGDIASPWFVQLVTPGGVASDFVGTPGAAVPSQAAFIAGWDGADLRPVATDITGIVQTALFAADLTFAGNLPITATGIGSVEGLDINLAGIDGTAIDSNSGVSSAGTQRVILATNQPVIPISDNSGSLTVDSPQLPAALVGARLDTNVGAWLGSTAPSVGQKAMTSSIPVVLASDQTTFPVTVTFPSSQVVDVQKLGGIAINLGAGNVGTGTQRVVIATDQSVIPISDNSGSLTVDSPQLPAALVGARLDTNVGAWLGSTAPSVGQKAMTSSIPVVISSDQATFPVTVTFPSSQVVDVQKLGGIAINLGAGNVGTGTQRVVIATDQAVIPISDNAGSLTVDSTQLPAALVGARLDVNNGAWLGSTAPSVGQKAMTSSLPVVLASDQTTFPVTVTFPSSQTVDVQKLGTFAINLGAGNISTGTQRFVLATDQPNLTTPLNTSARITNGTNEASILNTDPTTQYGLVTRNIPSGIQEITADQLPTALNPGGSLKVTLYDTTGSDFQSIQARDNLNMDNVGWHTRSANYIFNGNSMSRIKGLTAKGMVQQTILSGGDTNTITVTSTTGAKVGGEILLGGGLEETGIILGIPDSTTLQVYSLADGTAVNGTLHTYAIWEIFDIDGPKSNALSPSGITLGASVIYNPERQGYYLLQSGKAQETESLPVVLPDTQMNGLRNAIEELTEKVLELSEIMAER